MVPHKLPCLFSKILRPLNIIINSLSNLCLPIPYPNDGYLVLHLEI